MPPLLPAARDNHGQRFGAPCNQPAESKRSTPMQPFDGLTPRQEEILALLAQGLSNKEIIGNA